MTKLPRELQREPQSNDENSNGRGILLDCCFLLLLQTSQNVTPQSRNHASVMPETRTCEPDSFGAKFHSGSAAALLLCRCAPKSKHCASVLPRGLLPQSTDACCASQALSISAPPRIEQLSLGILRHLPEASAGDSKGARTVTSCFRISACVASPACSVRIEHQPLTCLWPWRTP